MASRGLVLTFVFFNQCISRFGVSTMKQLASIALILAVAAGVTYTFASVGGSRVSVRACECPECDCADCVAENCTCEHCVCGDSSVKAATGSCCSTAPNQATTAACCSAPSKLAAVATAS